MHVVSQKGYNMFVGTVMNICWVCSVKKKNYFGILLYHFVMSVLGLHLIPPPNQVSLQEQPVFELAVIRDGQGRGGISLDSTRHQESKHSE